MIKKNVLANLIGRLWASFSVLLFLPLQLKFLGLDAFGLVGFYFTLIGVLAFADMGVSATINREMARLPARGDSATEMTNLLKTYELTYLAISALIAICVVLLAPFIVTNWLQSPNLPEEDTKLAVQLMGLAISFQLPAGLFIGGLMGLQRQVHANVLQIIWSVNRGVGSILVLWLCSPTIVAFASWQVAANILYFITSRHALWGHLRSGSTEHSGRFRLQIIRRTWRYGSGVAVLTAISILITQLDKLALTKMLPIDAMGSYVLAATLASVPITLATPIASAVFPRFAELVARSSKSELTTLYHRSARLVSLFVIPAGLTLAIFAEDFLRAWTGQTAVANRAGLSASILILAQVLQAVTLIPFNVALANGDVKMNIKVGIVSILILFPSLIYCIDSYGMVGASLSLLIMNVITLPVYMHQLHARFLPNEFFKWTTHAVLSPVLCALPIVVLLRIYIPHTEDRLLAFSSVILVWFSATVTVLFFLKDIRNDTFEFFRKILRLSI